MENDQNLPLINKLDVDNQQKSKRVIIQSKRKTSFTKAICPIGDYNGPYLQQSLQESRDKLYVAFCLNTNKYDLDFLKLKNLIGIVPLQATHPETIAQQRLQEEDDIWHLSYDEVMGNKQDYTEETKVIDLTLDSSSDDEKFISEIKEINSEMLLNNNVPIIQEFVNIFKCDMCEESSIDENIIKTHMKETCHFSASTYTGKYIVDNSNKKVLDIMALKQSLSIILQPTEYNHIVVCPRCLRLFKDVYKCGDHYQIKHDRFSKKYAICKVTKKRMLRLPADPLCVKCSKTFVYQRNLNEHWRKKPTHLPYTAIIEPDNFVRFMCTSCDKSSEIDLYDAKIHAASCNKRKIGRKHDNGLAVCLNVFQIEKPREENIKTIITDDLKTNSK